MVSPIPTSYLQDIVYEVYRDSLEFDRLSHKISMRRLLKRLMVIFNEDQSFANYATERITNLQANLIGNNYRYILSWGTCPDLSSALSVA